MSSFHHLTRNALFVVLPVVFILVASARAGQTPTTITPDRNSLSEVRNKRRALLVVFRSGVVDASDSERLIIDQVLKSDPEPSGRFRWVYGLISLKINR